MDQNSHSSTAVCEHHWVELPRSVIDNITLP